MSFKRKIVSIFTSAACLISCVCIFGSEKSENIVNAQELIGQSAFEITSQMTIGWNLGNSLDATNNSLRVDSPPKKFVTAWGNPEPTQELFDAVQAGGFNTVRIPTTWYQHLIYNEETDIYEIDQTWMNYVKQTVDYAYSLGMFVIINVHHEEWVNAKEFTEETYAEASHKLRDIWTRVSEEFKDYDQHLIFEGMNEPRQTGLGSSVEWGSGDNYSRTYINNLNSVFIDTVRGQGSAANGERLLMLPGYCASSSTDAITNIAIPDGSGNVALSVHAYAPYFFTMDTSDKASHEFPGKSGYGEDFEGALKTLFNSLKSISDSKNVPIIIGEFSASDFNNTESRVNWAKSYLSKAKAAGIPCVLWDNNASYDGTGEAHGYVYRKTNTWYESSISVVEAMMEAVRVTEYSLPKYEEYVKPVFSWDNMNVGEDWVELYRSDAGKTINSWKNFTVSNWRDYINEDYKYVMYYDSDEAPTLIFQGGWFTVTSDDSMAADFTAGFTYQDIIDTLDSNDVALADMTSMYISATSKAATIYGLYAVPLKAETVMIGDVDGDNYRSTDDIYLIQQFLVNKVSFTDKQMKAADINEDGVINVFDVIAYKNTNPTPKPPVE